MSNSFNFINQPILSILNDAAHLLPGLKQVDLLFCDANNNSLQMKRMKPSESSELENIPISDLKKKEIVNFKNKLVGSRWYELNELVFADEQNIAKEYDLFDEMLKSVLCIGFESKVNQGNDVFVFYFKKDASEFGPMREDKILETTQKIVIERLLQSSLKAILNSYAHNRKVMADLNKNIQLLLDSKQQKILEQDAQLNEMKNGMDAIILGVLNELKNDDEIVQLNDGAKNILRPYLKNIPLLKAAMQKALNFARTISFGLANDKIVLHEDYFNEMLQPKQASHSSTITKVDEYSANTKMYQFLDALENAAQNLNIQGVKLTSSNVGGELEQPITAAAISDKLKNHSKKINLLLKQYPDQWLIVRNKFRPVVNIQERSGEARVA